ncbi:hypothetical protein ACQ4PT_029649 [Festuca glaucescens]
MAELLRRRVAGEPFPYSFIHEADPYSAAPEDLVHGREHAPDTDPEDGKGVAWYFCWSAKFHVSAGGGSASKRKRKVAAAGATYWHPETGKQAIIGTDRKSVGAYKRTLSYMHKIKNSPGVETPVKKKRLGWCMVEIGLDHAHHQLVLCKLYKPHPPRTHPQISKESRLPSSGMPCPAPAPAPAPLGAEIPSTVAIVRNGSAAAAVVTVVIDLCGSSIPPAQQMKDMANLVRDLQSPVVVCSAMGNTTTTILLAAWKAMRRGTEKLCEIHELVSIKELHLRTTYELGLETSTVLGSLDELEHQLQHVAMAKQPAPWTQDYLVSFGERTSTKIFSEYLNKLEGTLQEWKLCDVVTSGTGCSDLTATTMDRAMESREIQVWKDVDGIFRCDPKVCADATLVPHLTFDEAAELSDFAEQSMKLAMEYGISVRVRNPYKPQAPGTVITKTRDMSESTLTSIVLKSNITMLDIKSKRMQGHSDFFTTAFSKFKHFEYLGISVDCKVTTIEGKMSFTLVPSELSSEELIKQELDNAVEELQKIADVHRLQNVSVISLIGNAQQSSSIQEKALSVLRSTNAEVHKFSQDSSKVMKTFFVVENCRAKDCVHALHSAFFEKGLVSEVGGVDNGSSSSGVNRDMEAPLCGGQEWTEMEASVEEFIQNVLVSHKDDPEPIECDNLWDLEDLLEEPRHVEATPAKRVPMLSFNNDQMPVGCWLPNDFFVGRPSHWQASLPYDSATDSPESNKLIN